MGRMNTLQITVKEHSTADDRKPCWKHIRKGPGGPFHALDKSKDEWRLPARWGTTSNTSGFFSCLTADRKSA